MGYARASSVDRLCNVTALGIDAVARHRPQLASTFPARHVVEMELHELPGHGECLGLVAEFEDRVAADHFLGLDERAIGDAQLAVDDGDPRSLLQRHQPAHVDHPAGLDLAFGELAHGLHERGRRASHRLRGSDDGHEAHEKLLFGASCRHQARNYVSLQDTTIRPGPDRHVCAKYFRFRDTTYILPWPRLMVWRITGAVTRSEIWMFHISLSPCAA